MVLFFNPLYTKYSLGLKFLLLFDLDSQVTFPSLFFGDIWSSQLISCSSIPERSQVGKRTFSHYETIQEFCFHVNK